MMPNMIAWLSMFESRILSGSSSDGKRLLVISILFSMRICTLRCTVSEKYNHGARPHRSHSKKLLVPAAGPSLAFRTYEKIKV